MHRRIRSTAMRTLTAIALATASLCAAAVVGATTTAAVADVADVAATADPSGGIPPLTRPKHVLFVLIDDLGAGDVGYAGRLYPELNGTRKMMPTPTIDALANNGVVLGRYYVTQLCSPSRTSLLSGRYPYNIGQNGLVITNGVPVCLPLNTKIIPTHLHENHNATGAQWGTAHFGKWDIGMTSWGCTPNCRGYDRWFGFYDAVEDHFTHMAGGSALDLRDDFAPATARRNYSGVYSAELYTNKTIEWIRSRIASDPDSPTFTLLAHENVHGPNEVPLYWINEECAHIPETNPYRRIVCGMLRAVDSSLANITQAYKDLGIWEDTLVIFSTDNGGQTITGGNNYPLRGMKATTYEGGVRGVGFVSGAGLQPQVRGTISNQLISIADWYPTIVGGIAGLDLAGANQPTDPSLPNPVPLDGVDQFEAIATGSPSKRDGILIPDKCDDHVPCDVPGEGAILGYGGQYKLIHGRPMTYPDIAKASAGKSGAHCQAHSGIASGKSSLPVDNATSPPICPPGWVPAPESGMAPISPPEGPCGGKSPCITTNTSLTRGGTFLFDLWADPYEHHDIAAQHPDIVAALLAQLQAYNATNITQSTPPKDPLSNPAKFGGVWTPWRGDPTPTNCSKDDGPPPGADLESSMAPIAVVTGGAVLKANGWCWEPSADGGFKQLHATLSIDGSIVRTVLANHSRPGLVNASHPAPDPYHGFVFDVSDASIVTGHHTIAVHCLAGPPSYSTAVEVSKSPQCLCDGKVCKCATIADGGPGGSGGGLEGWLGADPPDWNVMVMA